MSLQRGSTVVILRLILLQSCINSLHGNSSAAKYHDFVIITLSPNPSHPLTYHSPYSFTLSTHPTSRSPLQQTTCTYSHSHSSYIPVLMSQAKIYWDMEDYHQVEKIFRKSVEFCSEHDTWKLNVAHVLFMQVLYQPRWFRCSVSVSATTLLYSFSSLGNQIQGSDRIL